MFRQFPMTTKSFLFLTLILTLAFSSCNNATPAGFWKNYKKDLLVWWTNQSFQIQNRFGDN